MSRQRSPTPPTVDPSLLFTPSPSPRLPGSPHLGTQQPLYNYNIVNFDNTFQSTVLAHDDNDEVDELDSSPERGAAEDFLEPPTERHPPRSLSEELLADPLLYTESFSHRTWDPNYEMIGGGRRRDEVDPRDMLPNKLRTFISPTYRAGAVIQDADKRRRALAAETQMDVDGVDAAPIVQPSFAPSALAKLEEGKGKGKAKDRTEAPPALAQVKQKPVVTKPRQQTFVTKNGLKVTLPVPDTDYRPARLPPPPPRLMPAASTSAAAGMEAHNLESPLPWEPAPAFGRPHLLWPTTKPPPSTPEGVIPLSVPPISTLPHNGQSISSGLPSPASAASESGASPSQDSIIDASPLKPGELDIDGYPVPDSPGPVRHDSPPRDGPQPTSLPQRTVSSHADEGSVVNREDEGFVPIGKPPAVDAQDASPPVLDGTEGSVPLDERPLVAMDAFDTPSGRGRPNDAIRSTLEATFQSMLREMVACATETGLSQKQVLTAFNAHVEDVAPRFTTMWNNYQRVFANDPDFRAAEQQRLVGCHEDPSELPAGVCYRAFQKDFKQRYGEESFEEQGQEYLGLYLEIEAVEGSMTRADRQRVWNQVGKGVHAALRRAHDKYGFESLLFMSGSHIHSDGELGDVFETKGMDGKAVCAVFRTTPNDVLAAVKSAAYAHQINGMTESLAHADNGEDDDGDGAKPEPSTSSVPYPPRTVARHPRGASVASESKWVPTAEFRELREGMSQACIADISRDIYNQGKGFAWLTLVKILKTNNLVLTGFPHDVRMPVETSGSSKGLSALSKGECALLSRALADRDLGADAGLRVRHRDYYPGDFLIVAHDYGLLPPAGASTEPSSKAFWRSSRKAIHAVDEENNVYMAAWDLDKPKGMSSGKKQPSKTAESVEAEKKQGGKKRAPANAKQAQSRKQPAATTKPRTTATKPSKLGKKKKKARVEASDIEMDDDDEEAEASYAESGEDEFESEERSISPQPEAPSQKPQTGGGNAPVAKRTLPTRAAAVAASKLLRNAASAPQDLHPKNEKKRRVAFADDDDVAHRKRSRASSVSSLSPPPRPHPSSSHRAHMDHVAIPEATYRTPPKARPPPDPPARRPVMGGAPGPERMGPFYELDSSGRAGEYAGDFYRVGNKVIARPQPDRQMEPRLHAYLVESKALEPIETGDDGASAERRHGAGASTSGTAIPKPRPAYAGSSSSQGSRAGAASRAPARRVAGTSVRGTGASMRSSPDVFLQPPLPPLPPPPMQPPPPPPMQPPPPPPMQPPPPPPMQPPPPPMQPPPPPPMQPPPPPPMQPLPPPMQPPPPPHAPNPASAPAPAPVPAPAAAQPQVTLDMGLMQSLLGELRTLKADIAGLKAQRDGPT